jgi:hypothetical protein
VGLGGARRGQTIIVTYHCIVKLSKVLSALGRMDTIKVLLSALGRMDIVSSRKLSASR